MKRAKHTSKHSKFQRNSEISKSTKNITSNGIFKNPGKNRCPRCGGFMVIEYCLDLGDDSGKFTFFAWRCIQCGELIDPIILKNRRHRPNRRQIERKDSILYLKNIEKVKDEEN